MAWHGTVTRPVRAGRAGPVWCRVAPARCSRPLELWRGPTKDREIGRNENAWPPDCSRSRRRSEAMHECPGGGADGPSVQESSARGEGQRSNPVQDRRGAIRRLVCQRPAASRRSRRTGSFPRKTKERGIVERKTGAGEGMEIGRSLSSRGAKRRCAVSPAKPQFPYEGGARLGGGLPRHHSTHPSSPCPSFPGQPSRPCAVY